MGNVATRHDTLAALIYIKGMAPIFAERGTVQGRSKGFPASIDILNYVVIFKTATDKKIAIGKRNETPRVKATENDFDS